MCKKDVSERVPDFFDFPHFDIDFRNSLTSLVLGCWLSFVSRRPVPAAQRWVPQLALVRSVTDRLGFGSAKLQWPLGAAQGPNATNASPCRHANHANLCFGSFQAAVKGQRDLCQWPGAQPDLARSSRALEAFGRRWPRPSAGLEFHIAKDPRHIPGMQFLVPISCSFLSLLLFYMTADAAGQGWQHPVSDGSSGS